MNVLVAGVASAFNQAVGSAFSKVVASALRRNRVVLTMLLCAAAPAAAQGNGHGNAYGHYKSTVSAPAHDSPQAAQTNATFSGTGVRNFGSWLDDATVQDPGGGYASFGLGVYKTPAYREIDVPSIDTGVGVTRKLQFGMTVPYYYANAPGDPVSHGFGDLYLNAKYQLREPTSKHAGFALIPMVEVLSVAPPSGAGRVQWALPASVERPFSKGRAMATGGYFSRGALFSAGALEFELSKKAWTTAALSYSYSTHHDDLSAALGFHKGRADASGGLTYALRPDVAVYGSIGRTISARDDNSASLIFSAGVSFGLKRPVH